MFREESQNQRKSAVKAENIFTRIAKSDNATLNKVQKLLVDNGIKKASNRLELYYKLLQLYKLKREAIIPSIIEIHPDKKYGNIRKRFPICYSFLDKCIGNAIPTLDRKYLKCRVIRC